MEERAQACVRPEAADLTFGDAIFPANLAAQPCWFGLQSLSAIRQDVLVRKDGCSDSDATHTRLSWSSQRPLSSRASQFRLLNDGGTLSVFPFERVCPKPLGEKQVP